MFKSTLIRLGRLLRPSPAVPSVNPYWRQLSASAIAAGEHRAFVGGYWEEIGKSQFEFMKQQGLLPEQRLIDVGCGALRGGVHFIRFLDKGNYFGIDMNRSLIEAGGIELDAAGLSERRPTLLVNDQFELSRFGVKFDYAVAISLFTHLYMNNMVRCLVEVGSVLKPGGRFYATFFEAPRPAHIDPIKHTPGNVTTNFDADPFHYSFAEMTMLAGAAGMVAELIGEWKHPRNQKMLCFSKMSAA